MRLPAVLLALSALALGQRPVPIDNEWVKVILVNSAPGRKTGLHEHAVNRVMIYLDPGSQRTAFESGRLENLNWKAGDALWSRGGGKHIAENLHASAYRIVEIELKKPGPGKLPALPLDPLKADPKRYKLEFENPQVRVLRARYGPREAGVDHEHGSPRVITCLTDYHLRITLPDGTTSVMKGKAGDVVWGLPARHREENLLATPFELVVVDLKP